VPRLGALPTHPSQFLQTPHAVHLIFHPTAINQKTATTLWQRLMQERAGVFGRGAVRAHILSLSFMNQRNLTPRISTFAPCNLNLSVSGVFGTPSPSRNKISDCLETTSPGCLHPAEKEPFSPRPCSVGGRGPCTLTLVDYFQ